MREAGINSRLIFASGRSLEALVQQGHFRKDFYFRLKSGYTVDLHPLRNDLDKIRDAIQYYSLLNHVSLSQRLTDFYETLAWPGNLRQLFGHLDKKKVLSRSSKLDFDFQDENLMLQSSDLMSLSIPVDLIPMQTYKKDYVKKAVSMCDGNISLTARKLKITEKTIKTILGKIS